MKKFIRLITIAIIFAISLATIDKSKRKKKMANLA